MGKKNEWRIKRHLTPFDHIPVVEQVYFRKPRELTKKIFTKIQIMEKLINVTIIILKLKNVRNHAKESCTQALINMKTCQ